MFYLTLPSNSSQQLYPDNTLTHYQVQLAKAVELEGRWEVGLSEIQYPHTWYNVRERDGVMKLQTTPEGPVYTTILKAGLYPTARKLVRSLNAMNEMIPENRNILFFYDGITKKVTVDVAEGAWLELSAALKILLGITQTRLEAGSHVGEQVVDVHQGFYSLYVYCNLLEPRAVGHSEVPLLRIVPLEGDDGDMVTKIYSNIQYVPLLLKNFRTVEIDIRKDTGERVPFERGKLVATLHFRRQRSL